MSVFFTGLTISIGLIVAIGAQNAWVLGMSVRRIHPWAIAITCFTIDAALMGIGTVSFKQIQQWLPGIIPWLTWVGIAMLVWLAGQSALRAIRGNGGLNAAKELHTMSQWQAVTTALAISLLNPHVYLDTVVLVGSIASTSSDPWVFWVGAATGSVVWFSALAAIGRPLSVWLSSPTRWRVFDGAMAAIITWVAVSLYRSLA